MRIVRLGSARSPQEGLRIGAVRRPPRGVPKSEYASRDIYALWFPILAPSEDLLKRYVGTGELQWKAFKRQFLAQMKEAGPKRDLDLLAALSHTANYAIGCYCEDEAVCHRSALRELLDARGADIDSSGA